MCAKIFINTNIRIPNKSKYPRNVNYYRAIHQIKKATGYR